MHLSPSELMKQALCVKGGAGDMWLLGAQGSKPQTSDPELFTRLGFDSALI